MSLFPVFKTLPPPPPTLPTRALNFLLLPPLGRRFRHPLSGGNHLSGRLAPAELTQRLAHPLGVLQPLLGVPFSDSI